MNKNKVTKASLIVVLVIVMVWLSKWEMPVDENQNKLDSLKRESAKLQIY